MDGISKAVELLGKEDEPHQLCVNLFVKNCGKFSDLQQFKGEYSDILSFTNFIITRRQDKKNKEVSL